MERSRGVIDTHAPRRVRRRPRRARQGDRRGVTRVVTIGTGIDSCRQAWRSPKASRRRRGARIDPPWLRRRRRRGSTSPPLLGAPKVVAVGETGLDGHHGADTLREQRSLFEAHLALADELRLPVVIHSRAASAETAAALVAFPGTVVLHCFSEPDLLERARARATTSRSQGTSPTPRRRRSGVGGQVPLERILAETDSPYLAPQPVRGRPEAGHVMHTLAVLAQARGTTVRELELQIDERHRRLRLGRDERRCSEEGARPALPGRPQRSRRDRAARGPRPTTSCSR